ncbi:iSPsy24, transposase OrfB family protein (plasmid) [Yersinia pestis 1045]|nr:hypothetical protein CH59_4422 [Yersinia pestis]AJI96821.1 hypothetical protein BZ18_4244 [Yersinia pestis Pestoides F]AJJ65320.1 hypothetical protein BZ16_4176 [Yersinia pseudotuberculosis PB1/+]AJJ77706.1 hypothetical protein CH58_4449 [Yersinia pestis Antiqua]AJJ86143.1 putative cytochrome o ubiquinol oxidase [Yersinia pestis Angola]AJJ86306.1 hypothetical protein AK38_4280 [Yersinia pestis CO92]AJK10447.1 hypothetical protein CH60_4306 [Yersinia pestis str. Pestoides B]AJK18602.1 hypo
MLTPQHIWLAREPVDMRRGIAIHYRPSASALARRSRLCLLQQRRVRVSKFCVGTNTGSGCEEAAVSFGSGRAVQE